MAKHKILCPISGKACVECAIYRGRHYYLCYSPAFRGTSFDPDRIKKLKEAEFAEGSDETFGMPQTIEIGSQCIRNVEEYGVEREFAALKKNNN